MNVKKDQLNAGDWWKVQGLEHVGTMLSCVCNAISNAQAEQTAALERIATALEHGHGEPEQVATLMRGVGLDHDATIEGSYVRKPSIELHRGLYGYGGVYRDDAGGSWFAMDIDPEFKADSPEDLRDIAELFRSNYADALEWIADEWKEQLDAGEVRLLEPDDLPNDNAYADSTAEWEFHNPDELDELAEFFHTKMPQALRALAATWRQRIADGTIPAREA